MNYHVLFILLVFNIVIQWVSIGVGICNFHKKHIVRVIDKIVLSTGIVGIVGIAISFYLIMFL